MCRVSKKANRTIQQPCKHDITSHLHGAERGSRTLRKVCYRAFPGSAMCVQNLDDSRGFAIRITYRISLRSSSLWEPRHPLLKVVIHYHVTNDAHQNLIELNPIRTTFTSRSSISARVNVKAMIKTTIRSIVSLFFSLSS